jgi:ketopantoate reductase
VESGKPSELEAMIGAVIRLGTEHNVPTPVMKFTYAMLKPGELEAQKF